MLALVSPGGLLDRPGVLLNAQCRMGVHGGAMICLTVTIHYHPYGEQEVPVLYALEL